MTRENFYFTAALLGWTFLVALNVWPLIVKDDTECPTDGSCEEKLEMERHLHHEYSKGWQECQSDVSRIVQQSIYAVCLEEYDQWEQYLDECHENKFSRYARLEACEEDLNECMWRKEEDRCQCRCRAWLHAGDEVHVEVIEPWETCSRHHESEDKCTFDSTWISRKQWLEGRE